MRHLSNSDIYTLLDSDPTDIFSQQIKQTITDMYQRNQISKKAVSFLSPTDCKAARFYLLPKIHKPGNPGRPIISGNGSPTEKISLFVDHFIKPLVPQINSYIHDTPDFLRKLEDIKNQIPSTAIIGTFDVTSLYTNIPHAEGIAATCAALSKKVHPCPPISDIKALMQQVLTKNNFTFMDKHYLQRHGTAMGTRMAPSLHACLCLALKNACSVNFLDVTVRKEHGSLSTDLYTKPTDTHQYLHSSSCHPRHCKSGIAYSQALRLRRICSNNSSFIRHTDALEKHLIARGHSARRVREAIQRVRSLSRSSTLAVKDKKGRDCDNKLPLVVTFHPNLPPLQKITSNNHNILLTSDRLQRAVPEKPIIAYRRPRNLRDLLVRAAVPPLTSNLTPIQHGTFKCDRTSRCIVCSHHIVESNSITSHSMQLTHKTKGHITCTTTNVIYLISCRVCGIQYVGETKTTLKKRFYGHRSTVNTMKTETPLENILTFPTIPLTTCPYRGLNP
ncbi:hypothetical protein BSL78_21493 [Apostichopus japonicus]|uniref:GIY-YIG domain-containing protein n=1 Tax=Stichopus japonicus TaxID=307972 RepID=A0A2G8K0Z2_STIJA|nr:hypothetical protein BSL78_21493 [Apostichopus japonicus]